MIGVLEDVPALAIDIAFVVQGGLKESTASDLGLFFVSAVISVLHSAKCIWSWRRLDGMTDRAIGRSPVLKKMAVDAGFKKAGDSPPVFRVRNSEYPEANGVYFKTSNRANECTFRHVGHHDSNSECTFFWHEANPDDHGYEDGVSGWRLGRPNNYTNFASFRNAESEYSEMPPTSGWLNIKKQRESSAMQISSDVSQIPSDVPKIRNPWFGRGTSRDN